MEEIFQLAENNSIFKKEVAEEIEKALSQNLVTKDELLKINIYNRKVSDNILKVLINQMIYYEKELEKRDKKIKEKDNKIKELTEKDKTLSTVINDLYSKRIVPKQNKIRLRTIKK